jgi:hypothetical protein
MTSNYFKAFDLIILPIYIVIIYYIAETGIRKKRKENPIYKYFIKGLFAKIFGGIAICLIYIFYYKGGDTINYFESSVLVTKLIYLDTETYISIILGDLSQWNLYRMSAVGVCCPEYWRDPQSFTVVRIASPVILLGAFSYLSSTLIISAFSYAGIWRLFLLFNELYPGLEKKFAIAILFLPSLIFWGSGILKDTITFSAACWFTWGIFNNFIKKEKRLTNTFIIIISAFTIISIKPYIFVALLPGTAIWLSFSRIVSIKNGFVRLIIAPAILLIAFLGTTSIMGALGSSLGTYASVDQALDKAVVTKNDLTREAYGKNSFDIGTYDASISGVISKFPVAVVAGLFRPFLWEAANPVMLVSALENAFLVLLTLRVLLRVGPFKFISNIFKEPLLIFSFIFAIFFSFSVGLTTANFGALVRYKIPALPFYLCTLFILESRLPSKKSKLY